MKKNTLIWITGMVLVATSLLFVPSMLIFGRSNWMHSGYGMMEGGWMILGWIIPAVILVLVIAFGVWLGNTFSRRGENSASTIVMRCANCSAVMAADWETCPYCSTAT